MIHVRWYQNGAVKELDPSQISDVVDEQRCVLWVDVCDPTEDDLECLQEEFSLHPLAIEDVRHRHQRPKLEQYPSHAFLVVYSKEQAEVDLFVGPNWLVSVRAANADGERCDVSAIRARFERTRGADTSVGFLLYTILDEIVDGYFDATDEAEDRLEALEARFFAERLADERTMQEELFALRRQLVVFRRAVVPMREVVGALLRREVEWLDDATIAHLFDRYYRASAHRGLGTPGLGLGLYLAREVALAHGGRIHAANRPGGGLCVTLVLPREVEADPSAENPR